MEWLHDTWAVYDLETTGVDLATSRVVQVGLVVMQNGIIQSSRKRLCNPGVPIPPEATAIHGITDEMVADAKPDVEVLTVLVASIKKHAKAVVSYNGLHFDDQITQQITGLDLDQEWANLARVDGFVLVKSDKVGRFWKGEGRHRLTTVCEKMGIREEGMAHDAETDCRLAGRLVWGLLTGEWRGDYLRRLLTNDHAETTKRMKALAKQQREDFEAYVARKEAAARAMQQADS